MLVLTLFELGFGRPECGDRLGEFRAPALLEAAELFRHVVELPLHAVAGLHGHGHLEAGLINRS